MNLRSHFGRAGGGGARPPGFEDLLAATEIPDPFDVQLFCERLSVQRGRPLHLHSTPGITATGVPCGAWIATERADHIFHEEATSPLHRTHIVLHEVSHMLLGHTSLQLEQLAHLFSQVDPSAVKSVLGRASYNTEDERAAEQFADLLARKANLFSPSETRNNPVLQRLDDALSDS
ncbi:secondary metabolite protein [Streptomyces sp. NPDC005791]|uniref:secondary metabolite protein n=1 Tax=Streptomyces sp. NPDC005791 TaxID=3364732 RepID=UPI0036A5620C